MTHGRSDQDVIGSTHNLARFFTENRQVSAILLAASVAWGIFAYFRMPQRKDPDIPVRQALVICPWPGVTADKVEQFVTRKIEERVAESSRVERVESITRSGVSLVYVRLEEKAADTAKEFDDVKLKLDGIRDLPEGSGPIIFIKDFGDTAALMLTVASPKADDIEIDLRARTIQAEIARTRLAAGGGAGRISLLMCFSTTISPRIARLQGDIFADYLKASGLVHDVRVMEGSGFGGVDCDTAVDEAVLLRAGRSFMEERLRASELAASVWDLFIVRNPEETAAKLRAAAGDKYSYKQLDDFTSLITRTLQTVPAVSKVQRSGVLKERIFLDYSQERLASYGLRPIMLRDILRARNTSMPGGVLELGGKVVAIDPSGELATEKDLANVVVSISDTGSPIYLRDMVDIARSYESPPRYLNFYSGKAADGTWQRNRAITVSVQMRAGENIGRFGKSVDAALDSLKHALPPDLVLARTSDQPLQVEENVGLFMKSLYEAIVLVVIVALIGFWEWRSALLMALSIPITLAMTFGMMDLLRIDIQQVSIASLIIALGLLVDDPVVAGDAIKRGLAEGHKPVVAAWLGPTKLATAILFATITNIVAYLPFLLLSGDTGRFLYSLPIVITCSLVASRIASMTFVPFLSYYLLRAPKKAEVPLRERRKSGFAGAYYKLGSFAIRHRFVTLAASFFFLAGGGFFAARLKEQFFPKDLSYLSYVDVWLPEDSTLSVTNSAAIQAERIIEDVCARFGNEHPDKDGKPRPVLRSLTTFVGGGGPRFWFSVSPEQRQLNYAQIIIQVEDKHETGKLVVPLQQALATEVPGARIDVRQLESGPPVGIPVAVRLSGEDLPTLRAEAEKLKRVFRAVSEADRVQDDWGAESFVVSLDVDPDRANLAGISNLDVAVSSVAGMNGIQVTSIREEPDEIPVLVRLRMEERSGIDDVRNLYVYSLQNSQRVPLGVVSSVTYRMQTEKIMRRNHFRTITVACFPVPGVLPSEVLNKARAGIEKLRAELPPGFKLEIGGEEEHQKKGFKELAIVMAISVAAIFLTLVWQFKNAVKPLIVFAAIPYGMAGALACLAISGSPFGFMAFLGIASLVGVIVSHVIVLFDFIEERHAEGEPLLEALLDAGIVRLRPVLITVGATVIGLVPLALHGGPLWEPLCYAQIGGLTAATFITLIIVPVLYAIAVLDLKVVKWEEATDRPPHGT